MAQRLNLLTKAEAAEILRVSEWTVEALIRNGQLPAYKIAKTCTRISEEDLLAYAESRKVRFTALRKGQTAGMREVKARQRINSLPCSYVPGMKVVDPHG